MRKLFAIATLIAGTLVMVSCGDDDGTTVTVEGSLTISGIPTNAQLVVGETLTLTNVSISAEDGIASFSVTAGGTTIDLLADATDFTVGDTEYNIASTTLDVSAFTSDIYDVVFTLTDNDATDPDTETFTHVLTITDVPVVAVTGLLTGTNDWTADNIYQLNGKVVVDDGATLNIAAGTIVKASLGEGSLASALVVARGGTLNASGTAEAPIIFTSVNDPIQPGEIDGGYTETTNGDWGGLIILGSGEISNADGDTFGQIEGIPADDAFGAYGYGDTGSNFQTANQTGSSGTIRYISIRHGGALIGQGNEINGLTLGGAGSGTIIEYVEVVSNADDGIEPFGGAANITNALVWNQHDDAYDCDESYNGTITNFIYIAGNESDHGFEIDGPKGTTHNTGIAKFVNGSFKGSSVAADGEYGDFRVAARVQVDGLWAFNFQSGKDFEIDDDGGSANFGSGTSSLDNIVVNSSDALTSLFNDTADNPSTAWDDPSTFASTSTSAPSSGLADKTAFEGWTFADAKGQLDDF